MDSVENLTPAEIWNRALAALERELSSVSIDRWFRHLSPRGIEKNTLILDVPDDFFKRWIEDHYVQHIDHALRELNSSVQNFELRIARTSSKPPELAPSPEPHASQRPAQPNRPAPAYDSRYTFDEFVVGPSNRFAHAAALAVAREPAKAYNPLFIFGPVGLGKTHLLQAIGHETMRCQPEVNCLYVTAEKFTNQLINAIQNRTTIRFREKFRNVDVLLIDDIHFLGGKEATQEEFFHTFNALHDKHKQIVVSSDRPPKGIPGLEERIISRIEWGLVTDIQAPDFETRAAILRKKAQRDNIRVPDEVTLFIAEKVRSNIRELEGALIRVVAYSHMLVKPITREVAQEVLHNLIRESEKKITVDLIQRKVAEHFDIRPSEMTAKRRSKNVVLPRQVAMYLSRELTDFSLPEIGGYFGGRDHTTVMHACDKIRANAQKDQKFKETIDRITWEIRG